MSLMESGCFESPTEQQICSWHLSWVVDGFASTCTLQLWPPPWGALQLPLNICPDWQRQGCSVTSAPDPTIYPDKPSSLPNPAPSCCCSPPPFFFSFTYNVMDIWGGNYLQCKDGLMTTDKMWMLWFIKANGSVDVLKNKCKINIQERSKCLHSLCFLFFFIEQICGWCCILYSFKRVLSIWLFILFFIFWPPSRECRLAAKRF